MLLSPSQNQRFWRDWSAIKAKHDWTPAQAEVERKALLQRAGFSSLTLVDTTDGFTRVLHELGALRENLAAMVHADVDENRKRILIHAINQLGEQLSPGRLSDSMNRLSAYVGSVMFDQFGHYDLGRLTEPQLTNLRNTLTARLAAKRRKARVSNPESEMEANPF